MEAEEEAKNAQLCEEIKSFNQLFDMYMMRLSNKNHLATNVNNFIRTLSLVHAKTPNLSIVHWTCEAAFKCIRLLSDGDFDPSDEIQRVASDFFEQSLRFSPSVVARAALLKKITILSISKELSLSIEALKLEIQISTLIRSAKVNEFAEILANLVKFAFKIQFNAGHISEKLIQNTLGCMGMYETKFKHEREGSANRRVYLPLIELVDSLSPDHSGSISEIFERPKEPADNLTKDRRVSESSNQGILAQEMTVIEKKPSKKKSKQARK